MICYHCGSKLGVGNRCLTCGTDVTVYRKILRISNTYYNMGLERAKRRDLTGAVEFLETSLQYNKNNTDARNLLGLIFYERGEVCEALGQWIVSKNLQPENNPCDFYLDDLKRDKAMMDEMDQAVKKYNQALEQTRIEGLDLAVITLKRVLKQQPRMVKAYQLLALIYIHSEEYNRASRLLKKALEIDRGDPYTRHLEEELQAAGGRTPRPQAVVPSVREMMADNTVRTAEPVREKRTEKPGEKKRSEKTAKSVPEEEDASFAPRQSSRDYAYTGGSSRRAAAGVLVGVVIGLCLYQFVIMRTVNRDNNTALNRQIAYYDTRLSEKTMEAKVLQDQLDALKTENEAMKADMEDYTSDEGILTQYDKLMEMAFIRLTSGEVKANELYELFHKLKRDTYSGKGYKNLYDEMGRYLKEDAVDLLYTQGVEMVNNDYYTKSIDNFKACLELNPDYDKAMYYLGVCYKHRKEYDTAKEYYKKIVLEYPDSEFYSQAVAEVGTDPDAPEIPVEDGGGEGVDGDENNEDVD